MKKRKDNSKTTPPSKPQIETARITQPIGTAPSSKRGRPSEFSGSTASPVPVHEGQAKSNSSPVATVEMIDVGDGKAASALPFPVIGIGASAGGLAAFETLFAQVPPNSETGMAFVIVQHLDPDHKSILSELVRRYAKMQVFEIEDGMKVESNCAYIIQPNKDLTLVRGKLHLIQPTERRGMRLPIDFFFRSLAQDQGEQAIGIILSGNGTDGTLGLRAIKEVGGIAMVQDPRSAEFDGMPRSAIASGVADYVVPPEEMWGQLFAYVTRHSKLKHSSEAPVPADISGSLLKIMGLLRAHNGHDLSFYKQNTIRRRVERRMAVNQVNNLDDYIRYLRRNRGELDTLFRELLIGVTNFFRDGPAFQAVRDSALTAIMTERMPGLPIRVWVTGCSTGEEAYSLAMLIQEGAEKLGREFVVQIFATDIDHESIEKARAGLYPTNIAADVSPERLSRFFMQEQKDCYRIKKNLRDQVIFAEQDVIKDPPFSKLDLISCRNLLIYLEPVLQKRLLPLFHYALAPGGFLLLGNSETVGEFTSLFSVIDRKWKLYRRRDIALANMGTLTLPRLPISPGPAASTPGASLPKERKPGLREVTERTLLRNHTPASVAVSDQGEILYIHGSSGKYLELPQGDANLNLLRAVRDGLKVELANALRKVVARRQPVHFEGLEVKTSEGPQTTNVSVELAEVPAGAPVVILVTFQEAPPKPANEVKPARPETLVKGSTSPGEKDRHIAALERELRTKTEALQTTVEELEASNEELKSTNEELQSTNEELQSTNEELETSKEELQSVNEELVTVNTELQQKMEGLARVNNDMNNLLAGTGIGVLFVDHHLCIQRFTPAATRIIKLLQSDIGRPVSDLVSNLEQYDQLEEDVRAVLDSLVPRENEVRTRDGYWYLMRILPYRTVENVIDGAVLTFVDINGQKRAEERLRKLSDDLEERVDQRVSELATTRATLAQEVGHREEAEARRATDISALRRLHDLTFQIARKTELPILLQTTLDAAMELTGSEMGSLQLYDPGSRSLELAAHRGFKNNFLDHFQMVNDHTLSTLADRLKKGRPVVIPEISQSRQFQETPALGVLHAAGVRAFQSTPVIAHDGTMISVFSTYWSKPQKTDEGTMRLLELLARQLADLLEARAQLTTA